MNKDERRLRDMWLSECWKTCPEWRQTKGERAEAEVRNTLLNSHSTDGPQVIDDVVDNAGWEAS